MTKKISFLQDPPGRRHTRALTKLTNLCLRNFEKPSKENFSILRTFVEKFLVPMAEDPTNEEKIKAVVDKSK